MISDEVRSHWREQLTQMRSFPVCERLDAWVDSLSSGDRVIFFTLATLVSIASLVSLYTLEQSLLVEHAIVGKVVLEACSPRATR